VAQDFSRGTGTGEEPGMARFFSFRPSFTLESRERYGFRGWAGKPTHPPLTDFPVSCFLLAAVFDVASLVAAGRGAGWAHDAFVAATWVQVAGLCTAVLAAVTGFLDRPAATPRTQARRTVNAHAAVMMTATVLALADLVLRVAGPASAGTPTYVAALGVVVAGLTACGAWIGGDLVFEHGFRVEPSRDTPAWNPSEVDILPGGQAIYPDRWRWPNRRGPATSNGFHPDGGMGAEAPAPGRRPADDALGRMWDLDELRHEGVISPEDFERKKLDLLSRI
jgi:uncharacterized membrane protein